MRERPFVSPGETNQSTTVIFELRGYFRARDLPFSFFRAQFHARDQAANILITLVRLHQQGIPPTFFRRNLRTDQRAHVGFFGGHIKTRRPIHAIAIEHRHRFHFALRAHAGQFFRQRSPGKKAERGPRMQFGIHQSYIPLRNHPCCRKS